MILLWSSNNKFYNELRTTLVKYINKRDLMKEISQIISCYRIYWTNTYTTRYTTACNNLKTWYTSAKTTWTKNMSIYLMSGKLVLMNLQCNGSWGWNNWTTATYTDCKWEHSYETNRVNDICTDDLKNMTENPQPL